MTLLRTQADISAVVPMPTDRVDDASTITAVTGETLTWFYVSSSAWASATGQAAGTLVFGKLLYTGILSSSKGALGSFSNTSLSFGASTRFDTLISVPENIFDDIQFQSPTNQKATMARYLTTNGYYAIDHRRGQVWGLAKATVANDTMAYSVMAPVTGSGGPSSNVAVTATVPSLSGTATTSNVSSSATNVTLLAANTSREGATFFNDSTQVLYLKFGATATSSSYTVQLVAGAYYELPTTSVYTGIIDGIWASANGSCRVTELT